MAAKRVMRLSEDHVARMAKLVPPDTGSIVMPGYEPATDEDFRRFANDILAGSDGSGQVWVFAYGSLIWKPATDFVEIRTGLLRGWHRSFCLRLTRWRATRDQPGLMMVLDRGGQCRGVLFRIPSGAVRAEIGKLFRREMSAKPPNTMPRWLTVRTEDGDVRAIGFVMNRKGRAYTGRLPEQEVADRLARAASGQNAKRVARRLDHRQIPLFHKRTL